MAKTKTERFLEQLDKIAADLKASREATAPNGGRTQSTENQWMLWGYETRLRALIAMMRE